LAASERDAALGKLEKLDMLRKSITPVGRKGVWGALCRLRGAAASTALGLGRLSAKIYTTTFCEISMAGAS